MYCWQMQTDNPDELQICSVPYHTGTYTSGAPNSLPRKTAVPYGIYFVHALLQAEHNIL